MCAAVGTRRPGNGGEWRKNKPWFLFGVSCARGTEGRGARRAEGERGTFHSLSGLISRPLGRLRLLLLAVLLLLLLLALHLLHVPLLGGRLKLT